MARVKRGVTAHARHKKIIKQAKGYGLFDKVAVGVSTATDTVLTLKGETPANAKHHEAA